MESSVCAVSEAVSRKRIRHIAVGYLSAKNGPIRLDDGAVDDVLDQHSIHACIGVELLRSPRSSTIVCDKLRSDCD